MTETAPHFPRRPLAALALACTLPLAGACALTLDSAPPRAPRAGQDARAAAPRATTGAPGAFDEQEF